MNNQKLYFMMTINTRTLEKECLTFHHEVHTQILTISHTTKMQAIAMKLLLLLSTMRVSITLATPVISLDMSHLVDEKAQHAGPYQHSPSLEDLTQSDNPKQVADLTGW